MNPAKELYLIALDLERYSSEGFKEESRDKLRAYVDRVRLVANDISNKALDLTPDNQRR